MLSLLIYSAEGIICIFRKMDKSATLNSCGLGVLSGCRVMCIAFDPTMTCVVRSLIS